jgi:hypothetical protein
MRGQHCWAKACCEGAFVVSGSERQRNPFRVEGRNPVRILRGRLGSDPKGNIFQIQPMGLGFEI